MKSKAFNPYLPGWEYIPDGEAHVFGDRVYVYGSHDHFGGHRFCPGDYMGWSAPVNDLSDWRCEGVIYGRRDDPANEDGDMLLFAPDVTRGPDGRYYLFYVYDQMRNVSVAVCDSPAGRYQFLGRVHYENGVLLGDAPGDEPQFDPGVLTEGDVTYLYTGFCPRQDGSRHGVMLTVLGRDMLTVREKPRFVVPSAPYTAGTGFEGHPFFEASSIRRVGERYYFIYSSVQGNELCYAVGDSPGGPFAFGGVIVSNCDKGIGTYKPGCQPMFYGGNNHGSIEKIGGRWYVFYHRQTNGTHYSRQGCMEPITILPDGSISQVEMTSCGGNGGPLEAWGSYPAYIACNLFCGAPAESTGAPGDWMDCRFPKITQEEPDGPQGKPFVSNLRDGATVGYKYFRFSGPRELTVRYRSGTRGRLLVKLAWDGPAVGELPLVQANEWKETSGKINFPKGTFPLYFAYCGDNITDIMGFAFGQISE